MYIEQFKSFIKKRCKQDSHDQFKTLSQVYKDLDYKQLQAKLTIRTRYNEEKFTIICTYINNIMNRLFDKE